MDNKVRLHECKTCNKKYSSYKSLWNHTNKYHNKNNVVIGTHDVQKSTNEVKINQCKYCNKFLNDRSYKYKHEKICKINDKNNKIEKLEKEVELLKQKINKKKSIIIIIQQIIIIIIQ